MKHFKLFYCLFLLLTFQPIFTHAQNDITITPKCKLWTIDSKRLLPPVATFTCSDTLLCEGKCITVVNTTSATLDSARWCVSGILIPSPLTITPLCFANAGVYEVNLFVYNGSGADTASITITVKAAPTPTIAMSGDSLTVTTTYAAYQWYKNGSIIPGATSQKHKPTMPGDYEAKVTDTGGCTGMSAMYTVLSTTNTALGQSVLSVSPNPNQGRFTLSGIVPSVSDGNELQIDITDVTGRQVHSQMVNIHAGNINEELSLKQLTAGIYLLHYSNGRNMNGTIRFSIR